MTNLGLDSWSFLGSRYGTSGFTSLGHCFSRKTALLNTFISCLSCNQRVINARKRKVFKSRGNPCFHFSRRTPLMSESGLLSVPLHVISVSMPKHKIMLYAGLRARSCPPICTLFRPPTSNPYTFIRPHCLLKAEQGLMLLIPIQ